MSRHHARKIQIGTGNFITTRRGDNRKHIAHHFMAPKTVVMRIGIKIGLSMDFQQAFIIVSIRPDSFPGDFTTNSDLILFKSLLIFFDDIHLHLSLILILIPSFYEYTRGARKESASDSDTLQLHENQPFCRNHAHQLCPMIKCEFLANWDRK